MLHRDDGVASGPPSRVMRRTPSLNLFFQHERLGTRRDTECEATELGITHKDLAGSGVGDLIPYRPFFDAPTFVSMVMTVRFGMPTRDLMSHSC
jgi:hypothetical protein